MPALFKAADTDMSGAIDLKECIAALGGLGFDRYAAEKVGGTGVLRPRSASRQPLLVGGEEATWHRCGTYT